jgi:hypothetical protein
LVVVGTAVVVLGLAAILFFFDPRQFAFYPRCPLYTLTGLHCPGCGALRGMYELLHGHWLAAVRMNCLLFPGLPALAGIYVRERLRKRTGATTTILQSPTFGWCAVAGVVLFWILRNVPVFPFTLLAP